MTYRPTALFLGSLILVTTACQPVDLEGSRFWQREKTSEAVYMRGPKAQQMLHRDIATCTAEINELTRLGAIKSSFPPDPSQSGRTSSGKSYAYPQSQEKDIAKWDTPEREGYLFTENGDYYDFDGCMMAKGWERTKFVDYDVIRQSRDNYIEAVEDTRYRSTHGGRPKPPPSEREVSTFTPTEDRSYND